MPPFGLSPNKRNNGLSLRESPWDPALTYRALTDPTAVDSFTGPYCRGSDGGSGPDTFERGSKAARLEPCATGGSA